MPTDRRVSETAIELLVSIPSSSGQWCQRYHDGDNGGVHLRFNPFFIRSVVPTPRDSLPRWMPSPRFNPFFIRSVVPTTTWRKRSFSLPISFNPFFIRSVVPTSNWDDLVASIGLSFNPFFIRSVVPTRRLSWVRSPVWNVSIPSSSGQWCQLVHRAVEGRTCDRVSIPSSSGQWCQLLSPPISMWPVTVSFNPFFIRSVVPTWLDSFDIAKPIGVSIPSSSGQWCQLSRRRSRRSPDAEVSIPSSSGQWCQPSSG